MSVQKPCLFLDRDGVIIKNVHYNKNPSHVVLMPGIIELLLKASRLNMLVIGVTNQSGLGRGWITWQDYNNVTNRMLELLSENNCAIDKIYCASYYENSQIPEFLEKPEWRKPKPGMILQACKDFPIDLSHSIFIGDRATDIECAQTAGIAKKILLKGPDFELEKSLVSPNIKYLAVEELSPAIL